MERLQSHRDFVTDCERGTWCLAHGEDEEVLDTRVAKVVSCGVRSIDDVLDLGGLDLDEDVRIEGGGVDRTSVLAER